MVLKKWSWGFTVSKYKEMNMRCGPEDLMFQISENDYEGVMLRI